MSYTPSVRPFVSTKPLLCRCPLETSRVAAKSGLMSYTPSVHPFVSTKPQLWRCPLGTGLASPITNKNYVKNILSGLRKIKAYICHYIHAVSPSINPKIIIAHKNIYTNFQKVIVMNLIAISLSYYKSSV